MPYTPSQNKLFRAAEHNPAIAKSAGIPQGQAAKMAHEGVKPDPKKLGAALKNHK
jgi:hypothetical protein